MILVVALVLMIAIEASSFLSTSTFVGGKAHPTADGVTVIFVPAAQCLILRLAALSRGIARMREALTIPSTVKDAATN